MTTNDILKKFTLEGDIALVTGASRGLGRRFACVLANMGAKVVLAARNKEKLNETKNIIIASGGDCCIIEMDVTKEKSIHAGFEEAKEKLGNVNILINNAGIAIAKSSINTSMDDWNSVINTNLNAVFACSKVFAKNLIDRNLPGKIINISSIASEIVLGKYLSSYCSSKAAVSHLTRTLAFEYAEFGIQVNAIAPGYILTDLNKNFFDTEDGKAMVKKIPLKRLGNADELDGVLLLLCSSAGSFITGSVMRVDGGHVIA